MNTRVAAKSDLNTIKNLWENSRGGGIFTQWFFDKIFYSANAVVAERDGETVACACTVPYVMNLNQNNIDVSYIGATVANPENRIPEVMNTLVADTLGFIAAKDMPMAFAVPDNYKFLERYGFSTCYGYKQYDIAPEALPFYGINGTIMRPKAMDNDVFEMVDSVYRRFTKNKNGYTVRSFENWKNIFDDFYNNFSGRCVIYKNHRDEVVGYMLYVIRDNKMGVYELAYSRREGLEGLIGFIQAHKDTVNKLSLKVPSDDLLYLNFCDSRMAVTECPFAMARITDAKKILKLYKDNAPENLRLQIIDRVMESNNKTFTFTDGDLITIDTDANVATDIGTLTQLVLGYLSVEEAASLNMIKGDVELLGELFKKQTTYVNMLIC